MNSVRPWSLLVVTLIASACSGGDGSGATKCASESTFTQVQEQIFEARGWTVPAEGEGEVCYVSYYDYTDEAPEELKVPCSEAEGGAELACFAYTDVLLAQDPQSHHSIGDGGRVHHLWERSARARRSGWPR